MLLLISLCLLLALCCLLSRKRFEVVVAPYACGLMLLAYALALFKLLAWFEWIIAALCVAALAWLIVRIARGKGRGMLSCLLTPGLVCFALLCVFYVWGNQLRIVSYTDDIYYWAMEVRSLFAQGGLVDATKHLSTRFMTYTPGMQVYEWIGIAVNGEWSEPIVFAMLHIFYAALLMPFARRITWKKAYWAPLFLAFAVGIPTVMNGYAYVFLGVDTVQGLCLGLALCQIWALRDENRRGGFELASLTLTLCALVLIKQTGILWLMMALLLLVLIKPRKQYGIKAKWLAAVVAAPLLCYASWKVFCSVMGLNGIHLSSLTEQISSMLAGTYELPEGIGTLPQAFWLMLTRPMKGNQEALVDWAVLEIPRLYWMLGFVLIPLVASYFAKQKAPALRRLALWMGVCDVLALLGYAFTFFTSLKGTTTPDVNEYWLSVQIFGERYLAPLMIGEMLLLVSLGICAAAKLTKPRALVLGIAAAVALGLLGNWQSVHHYLVPDAYWASEPADPISLTAEENMWRDGMEDPQDAIVLYGTDSYPYRPEFLQYAVAPAKLVLVPETELSQEDFEKLIQDRQVTHVVCISEGNAVFDNAVSYTEDGWVYDNTLYTVHWEDGALTLSEE